MGALIPVGQVSTAPTFALRTCAHLSEGQLGKGAISGAEVGMSRYPLAYSLVIASQPGQGKGKEASALPWPDFSP